MFAYILFFFIVASVKASQIDPLIVTLPTGQILGHELKSTKNNTYYAFQEIPYASPPVGDLRFKEAIPPKPWNGILDTTINTKICYQTGAFPTSNVVETEDCLYLNVYTPVKPAVNSSSLLPVFFWIHGGGFRMGDGTYQMYGPGHFMDYDVIVVTINYRVGPFGFLTTGDGVIPGNLGLKDQQLALNWTHQNIELFGGDPDKITIAGESAGAASVGYHLLSKRSSGLFRGVILESGSALSSWGEQLFSRYYAYQMGSALDPNFTEKNSSLELLELLREISAADIINANVTVTPGRENGVALNLFTIWTPVVEDEDLDNAFVVGPMEDNLENGNVNQVPIMLGFNSEEYLSLLRGEPNLDEYLSEMGNYFDQDLSRLINNNLNMTAANRRSAGDELRRVYTEENFENNPAAVVKFISDQAFTTPVSRHAELQSKYTDVYLYQISFKGILGGDNPVIEGTDNVGHGDELMYIWNIVQVIDINEIPASDKLTHDRMLTLWTNFVKFLNPTPTTDPLLENITWPKVSPNNMTYLNINLTLEVKADPKKYKEWKPIIDAYAITPLITY